MVKEKGWSVMSGRSGTERPFRSRGRLWEVERDVSAGRHVALPPRLTAWCHLCSTLRGLIKTEMSRRDRCHSGGRSYMSINIKIQGGIGVDPGTRPSFSADIFRTSFLAFTFSDRKSSASPVTCAAALTVYLRIRTCDAAASWIWICKPCIPVWACLMTLCANWLCLGSWAMPSLL